MLNHSKGKITGMNTNQKSNSNRNPGSFNKQAVVIADLTFLIRFLNRFPVPLETGLCPVLYLPELYLRFLPEASATRLKQWQAQERIIVCETCEKLLGDVLSMQFNPGMTTADYLAFRIARQYGLSVVSSTLVITSEARFNGVGALQGDRLLRHIESALPAERKHFIRVRKNNIIPAGGPASIAGNT